MTNLMKDERLQLSHKSSENILFFVGKVMDNYSKFDVTVSLQSIPFPHKAFVCMSLHILENICNVCISDQCLNWKKKKKEKNHSSVQKAPQGLREPLQPTAAGGHWDFHIGFIRFTSSS